MTPSSPTQKQPLPPNTAQKALNIATWLKEKKAEDISILDVSGTSFVTDVMIILTAQGARHAQALADWLLKKLAESGMACLGMEGYREGRWILVDCNDVLAHIFQEDSRRFYNLEGLWSQSPSLFSGGLPDGLPATGTTVTSTTPPDKA